jgi:CubicO group peptidase (beta-lactamase class C family)
VLAADKLDMPNSSYTAAAIEAAPDHAVGHVWTPEAASPVDFSPIFPHGFGAAGDINTTARSLVKWLRLQINDGKIPETDRYLVSAENLDKTRQIQVQIKDYLYYALGWMVLNVPYDRHKSIVLHDGSTLSFGSFAGWWQGTKTGVVILTNAQEKGLPSALGLWILEKLDGRTPPAGDKDYVEMALNKAKENYQDELDLFERPKDPLPTSLDGWDGEFANSSFGKADLRREKALRSEDDTLILKLATGAELELKPWSGDKLTESLVATGDFEALAKNLGALPLGFATLVSGAAGAKRDLLLELDGQSYQFQR